MTLGSESMLLFEKHYYNSVTPACELNGFHFCYKLFYSVHHTVGLFSFDGNGKLEASHFNSPAAEIGPLLLSIIEKIALFGKKGFLVSWHFQNCSYSSFSLYNSSLRFYFKYKRQNAIRISETARVSAVQELR